MSTSSTDRRTAIDRRGDERRRLVSLTPVEGLFVSRTIRTRQERRLGDVSAPALEPIRRLAIAVEALAAQLFDRQDPNPQKPTCTVEEAAALLGTTAKGIYALHERGKLPRSIGPGRRLVFLREDLLQLARRASPSGGHGR